MGALTESEIVERTSEVVREWFRKRLKKFRRLDHKTMAVNPFLAPVVMALHSHMDFGELGDLLLDGHFMTGHNTGFGKMVDEKLLPALFGVTKLNKKFRRENPPFDSEPFSEIDHVVGHGADNQILMTLKASRWTIQRGQAENINNRLADILAMRESGNIAFSEIVVGVFYGTQADLTDKFDIIRGICSGAKHSVTDISQHVTVVAGREFWSWVNVGVDETQEWVLRGVLDAVTSAREELRAAKPLLDGYRQSFANTLKHLVHDDGSIDWQGLLREVNG